MSQPIFIAGLGRSGTTMLYRLLDRHPRIAMTNEARVADFLVFASSFAGIDLLDTGSFLFTGLDPRYVASVAFGDNGLRSVGTLSFALSPTDVPEPGTVALLFVAIAMTFLQKARRSGTLGAPW